MTAKQTLKAIFGVDFQQEENITAVRQYRSKNTFCLDSDEQIIAIHSSENEYEDLVIPSSLGRLQYLNVSDNPKLRSVIIETTLPELWHFDASNGALQELKLPSGFEELRWLDVSRNQLTNFIPQGQFKKLTYLDLSNNQLNDFPSALLAKFPKLEGLYLKGNENFPSTKNLSINKEANCLPFMQRFARELSKGKTINNEFKVLLVGNGGVGKTCLVERLVYDSFEKKHLSTHGVALEQYIDEKNQKDFPYILNLWDFGGQDIYHATHRLFMQSNAIYLALWDEHTRINRTTTIEEDGEQREYENFSLQYWLHYIRHQGGNSPVMVVKTKAKADNSFHPQQQELQARYGVSEFLQIDSREDNWTENGFDRLLFVIKESIKKLRQEQELPQNWADLRQHLRQLQKAGNQVLSVEEYLDIADDHDIESPMEVLTDWLVTSGVVFYREGYFGSTIILDQEWAIKAIYTIFKRTDDSPYYRIKEKQNGKFTGKDLQAFWHSAKYDFSPAEQELLVNFMLGCELCFETKPEGKEESVPFEKRQFFAPQMMPDTRPDGVDMFLTMAPPESLLYVRYAHSFLHYGIIQSFIVRTQALANVRSIWKYGILLKENNQYAVVKELNKEIHVIATVENIELLDKIRNTLEDLQKEKVAEFVSRNGVDYVAMEELRGWKDEKIMTDTKKLVPTEDFAIFLERKKQERFQLEKDDVEEKMLIRAVIGGKDSEEHDLPNDGEVVFDKKPGMVLFLQANPTNQEVSWEKEYTFIARKIQRLKEKEEPLILKLETFVSLPEMNESISDYKPHIVHFSGHGEEEVIDRNGEKERPGGLVFHNENKTGTELIGAEKLEHLFRLIKEDMPNISIVILNACHSQEQAKAISNAGIYTIGTSDEIISSAARLFAGGFYRELISGMNIIAAIRAGIRSAICEDTKVENLIHLFYNGEKITLKPKNK